MKKYIALLLALVMALSLAACGKTEAPATTETPAETVVEDNYNAEEAAAALVSESFIDPTTEWGKYDELVAGIYAATDYAARVELMREAEDTLMSNFCIVPIYYYNDVYMQQEYVTGNYSNVFGTKFFMYATLSEDAPTQALRLNLASEPDYLDPALNSSVDGACLAANAFTGLYTYNAEGLTEPALAESYEMTANEDGTYTYTVAMKSDLKWSNGEALTAADFEYSWKRAAATETAADYGYMFGSFVGYPDELAVTAIDDTTLEFTMAAPCAYIEDLMSFPTFFPVNKAFVEANSTVDNPGAWAFEAGFVCNGAYTLTEWKHDVAMTYEKNPNFYRADEVTIEKQEYMLSADDTAIYAAYNAGNLDFIDSVPTDEVATLLSNPEFYIIDNLGTYYVSFNVKSPLFADKTPEQAACMRMALSALIDRDYICETVGQTGQVAASTFNPQGIADGNGGIFWTDAATEGYFDPYAINNDYEGTMEYARELLKAAGYKFDENGMLSSETPISFEYLTNESSGHIAVAEAIQADLAAIGVNMTIQVTEWNVFLDERKSGNYDVARNGWLCDFNDPINMLEMWLTESGNNDCQFGR